MLTTTGEEISLPKHTAQSSATAKEGGLKYETSSVGQWAAMSGKLKKINANDATWTRNPKIMTGAEPAIEKILFSY